MWSTGQNQQDDSKQQPIGGEMGGPPMVLGGGASSSDLTTETSGNQMQSRTSESNPFDYDSPQQQPPQNAMPPQSNPFGGNMKFKSQQPPLNQQSLIKSVLKLIPKFGPADKDRHQYRESLADSLVREGTNMSKDRLLELDKQVKQFVEQKQLKFSNDGCSSGGSQGGQLSPHTLATSIDSSNNKVALVIQLSLWVEEIIFEKYQDSGTANYKTLVRRLSQALRQKEEQKSTLMTCSDRESVNNFVQEFMNQRSGGLNSSPFGRSSAASSSQYAQGAPGTGTGTGNSAQNNSANAGGEAQQQFEQNSQNNNQEQSAQQNPFGGMKSPFGAPAMRGAPRGRAQGRFPTRGPAGRGRAMASRFVAPMANFSVPASSGSQNTNAPPIPNDDNQEQQTNQQSNQNDQNQSRSQNNEPAVQVNQSPQQQMIESGTDYDSSVVMTTSLSPPVTGSVIPPQENQIKGNDQNSDEREGPLISQNFSSQLKDSGSLERDPLKDELQQNKQTNNNLQSLDFLDQMIQEQQNSAFTGDAPSINVPNNQKKDHGKNYSNLDQFQNHSLNDQNNHDKVLNVDKNQSKKQMNDQKNFEIGPSSGDMFNQSQENQAQANDQQNDSRAGRGGAVKKVEKEEISSVGISKFQNESEERPDYDRQENILEQNQQPINAQAQNSQQNIPNTSSAIYQGQQEANSNQQTASSLFDDNQPSTHEQKFPNSNQGGQQSQFDQSPEQQITIKNQESSKVTASRKIQNQQDHHNQQFEESKGHQSSQQLNSNQQQEQFGNQKATEDMAANDARGGGQDNQGLFLPPGETGSQQQQNQQNSNQQQAIDNTTNQQNSQPPCSMDDIMNEPPAAQQYQMRFNTIQDDLIDDGTVINKLNLSMHSKPSGATSGRITPPSNYSSSRRLAGVAEGLNSGSRKNYGTGHGENEGTGSIQMSNDQSAGETFMQNMQFNHNHHKKINEQNMYPSTQRNSLTAPMGGSQLTPMAGSSDMMQENPYRSFNVNTNDSQPKFNLQKQPSEIIIDDYQSEQNVGKKSQKSSAKVKKSSKTSSKNKTGVFFNQTHGYIPHQSALQSDHLGATSVASIPVTTFEDTQKMLQAYKKKKREIMKMKDVCFKLEQEYMSVKQKNLLVEEELATTQKRLQRVEKQLKQKELKEHINDDSIAQRQLQLKNQEHELTQSQLKHQKAENTKLREKVKELLKKCSLAAQQQSQSPSLDSSMPFNASSVTGNTSLGPSEADLKVIEQQHQLELVRQREQKNLEIARLQDELQFQRKEQERNKERMQEVREEATREATRNGDVERHQLQNQIEEIRRKSQQEIEELKQSNEQLNQKLNEQKFKRSSRPQSGNNESESRQKAELANYEKLVKDLNHKLKESQELYAKEKEMILAEAERKDAIYAQLEQEKSLMQIQIDQLEQSNQQYQVLQREVSERADRLELENGKLHQELETLKSNEMNGKNQSNQPVDVQNDCQKQFNNLQGNLPLSQSQADWQVVDSDKMNEATINAQVADQSNNIKPIVFNDQPEYDKQEQALQPPPTAQGLFQNDGDKIDDNVGAAAVPQSSQDLFQTNNTAQSLFAPTALQNEKNNQSAEQQNFIGGSQANVMIQSQYFGETQSKPFGGKASQNESLMTPLDADASASFFDNLASQQQQPQGSQQFNNQSSVPVYNFDSDNQKSSSNAQVQYPKQLQKQNSQSQQQKQQPVEIAQPQPPAPIQTASQEADPYGFMLDDDDDDNGDNAFDSSKQPTQARGSAVIPTSMFD